MRLDLIREEGRRFPLPKAEKDVFAKVIAQGPAAIRNLALSQFCDTLVEGGHYRCTAQWCECPCHDGDGTNLWMMGG